MKNTGSILLKYVWAHKVIAFVLLYFCISVFLKMAFEIDILIPCIWKTLFHVDCPGCGLTRAFMKLISLDFQAAYHLNPMIFIVFPSVIYFLLKDFLNFRSSQLTPVK